MLPRVESNGMSLDKKWAYIVLMSVSVGGCSLDLLSEAGSNRSA